MGDAHAEVGGWEFRDGGSHGGLEFDLHVEGVQAWRAVDELTSQVAHFEWRGDGIADALDAVHCLVALQWLAVAKFMSAPW